MKPAFVPLLAFVGMITMVDVSASAFTFLGYPSIESIEAGRIRRWEAWEQREAFSLTYAIDDDFFAFDPSIQGAARDAAVSSLTSWASASMGLSFEQCAWGAVPNDDDITHYGYEGPGIDEYVPGETPLPGWGANIDFFTRPTGFEMVSEGRTYTMAESNLGFAVVNFTTRQINSVDIYLNSDSPLIDWTVSGGSGFDVETVLLHEIGHGLGLDHPNQAEENNAPNLDPTLFLAGQQPHTSDVMHSMYTGTKRELTADETSALWYLYPVIDADTGDLTGDGQVDQTDLAVLLTFYDRNVPVADFTFDGLVGISDLGILLSLLSGDGGGNHEAPPDPVPAPAGALVFGIGSLALLGRRFAAQRIRV
ncbi:MAG: matrixin family metalloprotease [Phycisphaerales bacterium]|nr:matrixin family metalloprotease [Phycisphaerales bacterium]